MREEPTVANGPDGYAPQRLRRSMASCAAMSASVAVRSVDPLDIDDRDHVDKLGISKVDFKNCSVIAALNRERGPAASDLPAGESCHEVLDEGKSFVVSHVGRLDDDTALSCRRSGTNDVGVTGRSRAVERGLVKFRFQLDPLGARHEGGLVAKRRNEQTGYAQGVGSPPRP